MPVAATDAPSLLETDHTAPCGDGQLFVRSWTPTEAPVRGTPIVMLHDSLGSVGLWRGFPAALAAATGRRVVAYDRLGFGQSSASPHPIGDDFIAAEAGHGLSAVLAALDIDRFVALGHSVGGGMAIEAAAQWPSRCEALITLAAQVFAEERTLIGIRAAKESFKAPDQLDRLRKHHGDKAPWVLAAWTESWLAPQFARWSLQDVLPRVQCPVLSLHGELDEFGSPVHPQMIERLVAGPATVTLMAGVGHVPHREVMPEVLERIVAFLP